MYVRIPASHKDLIIEFLVKEMLHDLVPAPDEGPLDDFPTLPNLWSRPLPVAPLVPLVKFRMD